MSSEGVVHHWVYLFRINIYNQEESSRPSIVSNELVQKINEKSMKTTGSHLRIIPENCSHCFVLCHYRKVSLSEVLCLVGVKSAFRQPQNTMNGL